MPRRARQQSQRQRPQKVPRACRPARRWRWQSMTTPTPKRPRPTSPTKSVRSTRSRQAPPQAMRMDRLAHSTTASPDTTTRDPTTVALDATRHAIGRRHRHGWQAPRPVVRCRPTHRISWPGGRTRLAGSLAAPRICSREARRLVPFRRRPVPLHRRTCRSTRRPSLISRSGTCRDRPSRRGGHVRTTSIWVVRRQVPTGSGHAGTRPTRRSRRG